MKLVTVKTFMHLHEAELHVSILKENDIPYEVETIQPYTTTYVAAGPSVAEFIIKVPIEFEDRAVTLLYQLTETPQDSTEHYLYSFSNVELRDVISKPDEWNELDVQLAMKILNERGEKWTQEDILSYQEIRIAELSKGKPVSTKRLLLYMIIGFVFPYFTFLIGLIIKNSKQPIIQNKKVYIYDEISRERATLLIAFGLIGIIISLVLLLK